MVQFDARPVVAELDRMIGRTRDLRPAWDLTIDLLEKDAADRFASGGQGDWPELDPDTIARRLGGSTQVLVETGRLAQSLTGRSSDAIRDVTQDRLRFGTEVPYAVFVAGDRDPLPELDGDLEAQVERILINHVTGDFR